MSEHQQSKEKCSKQKFEQQKQNSPSKDNPNQDILSSQEQQIEQLQEEISRKLEDMKNFQEQMKKRRIEQQIDEKEQENPFVVKETYVDRQLKKIHAKSGDLKIVNSGQDDEQQMQRKVQEILKKINL